MLDSPELHWADFLRVDGQYSDLTIAGRRAASGIKRSLAPSMGGEEPGPGYIYGLNRAAGRFLTGPYNEQDRQGRFETGTYR